MNGSAAAETADFAERMITRLPCYVRVVAYSNGRFHPCHVIDFSPLGCRLSIGSPGELGQRVSIQFQRANLTFLGQVLWRDRQTAGVRFDRMDAQPYLGLTIASKPERLATASPAAYLFARE